MHKENFVAYLTVRGRVLRERDGVIQIPFGSEYSICLKNLNSRLAVVEIDVDGESVLDDNRIVVYPDNYVELEGYMRGNIAKNKFKFIEKTQEIEDYRGNRPDDGLIRIKFKYQKPPKPTITWSWNYQYWPYYWYDDGRIYPSWNKYETRDSGAYFSNTRTSSANMNIDSVSMASISPQTYRGNITTNPNINNDGITVKGNEISQEFTPTFVGELEDEEHIIVLRLTGYGNKNKIQSPVTTKSKIICSTCGKSNSSSNKFCNNCGTFLN